VVAAPASSLEAYLLELLVLMSRRLEHFLVVMRLPEFNHHEFNLEMLKAVNLVANLSNSLPMNFQ